jgi:RNA polymerase sigma factor (sigma-70 family)
MASDKPFALARWALKRAAGIVDWGSAMQITSYDRDFSLVRKAQSGNRAAFAKLVHLHDARVLKLALWITGSASDAQYIYQEAFLNIFKNLAYFRYQCRFSTWIYRIVANVCVDQLRRNRKRRESSPIHGDVEGNEYDLLTQIPDEGLAQNPEQQLLGCEVGTDILCVLQALALRERLAFGMNDFEGINLDSVRNAFATLEPSDKTHLIRARHKLRLHLARCTTMRNSSMERH